MAKAITSAYFPMGAITIEEELYQAMLDESRKIGTFGHGFTYTAHPVGCAVALKTIEIYERDKHRRPCAQGGAGVREPHRQACRSSAGRQCPRQGPYRRARTCRRQEDQARLRSEEGVGAIAADILQEQGVIVRAMGD